MTSTLMIFLRPLNRTCKFSVSCGLIWQQHTILFHKCVRSRFSLCCFICMHCTFKKLDFYPKYIITKKSKILKVYLKMNFSAEVLICSIKPTSDEVFPSDLHQWDPSVSNIKHCAVTYKCICWIQNQILSLLTTHSHAVKHFVIIKNERGKY